MAEPRAGATVLLARPHPAILGHMAPFLSGLGLDPVALSSVSDIESRPPADLCGAVISTTVKSLVPAAYPEVLERVRAHAPGLPVVFATIADARVIGVNIEAIVRRLFGAGSVALTTELDPADPRLGSSDLYLVVTKSEVVEPSEPLRIAVARHFDPAARR